MLFLFACLCIELKSDTIEDDYRPKINNEKRYTDLLGDPFNKRLLSVTLDIRSYAGDGGYAVHNLDEFKWCREQGVKALPLMLEVLKREPTPNVGDSGEIWFSLRFKSAALIWIRDFPAGDAQPFLEEVRRQLPAWLERQIANHDSHTGFICDALELLAREGDATDISLMESFLNDANPTNKYNAQKNLVTIKKRLASLSNEESGIPGESSQGQNHQNSSSRSNKESQNLIANEKTFNLLWLGSGLLIIGVVALVLRVYKRGSKT